MKRLKDSTIKSYSAYQLAKHLDRLMDLHEDAAPYRINLPCDALYVFCDDHITSGVYEYRCSINDYNKDVIIDAIESEYRHWGVYSKQGETITRRAN